MPRQIYFESAAAWMFFYFMTKNIIYCLTTARGGIIMNI